jgi:integrase
MTKKGLKKNTIDPVFYTLQSLNRVVDLMNPEAVKLQIGKLTKNNGEPAANATKQKTANNYDYFVQTNGLQWEKPSYTIEEKTPITPTLRQAEEIIAASPTLHAATIFRILSESGFEGEELHQTTARDIDTEQGIISVAGHKLHNGRQYKFKQSTAEMLRMYMAKTKDLHPFPRPPIMADSWRTARAAAAKRTGNNELLKIPLKGLRNLSGIIKYQKTKSPWEVMLHMGHKKLDTTQHYLLAMSQQSTETEWTGKIASNKEERLKLIEEGYTLVEKDGADWYFKIPKT